MARPRRIDLPNCFYYLVSRTYEGELAFVDQTDRRNFLKLLEKFALIFGFRVHAWRLMQDHFLLLVESGQRSGLSEFMRRLLTAYTVYYNQRHGRSGHLFHGRFKSYVVDKKSLADVSRHIHLAPGVSRGRAKPETYRGSSLRYYLKNDEPEFLITREVLSRFNGSRKKYADFVRQGRKIDTTPESVRQIFIGTKPFIRRMEKRVDELQTHGSRPARSFKKKQERIRKADKKRAKHILGKVADYFDLPPRRVKKTTHARGELGDARILLVNLLRENLPWTGGEIVQYLGLRQQNSLGYFQRRMEQDPHLTRIFRQLDEEIKASI